MARQALVRYVARTLIVAALLGVQVAEAAYGQSGDCPEPNARSPRACPLSGPVAASLSGPDDQDAYRFDALDVGVRARIELSEAARGLRLELLDWGGRVIAEASEQAGAALIDVPLAMPGTYFATVSGSAGAYRLGLDLTYPGPTPRVLLSREMVLDDAPGAGGESATTLANGQYTVQTLRGGSPGAGVAVARALTLADGPEVADFTLVADARFEQAEGSVAIQARFRYRPEAGGGSGYIVSYEPFEGRLRLAAFEEGRQQPLTEWVSHPAARSGFDTSRLMVRAVGPTIVVAVNGEELIREEDTRYTSGSVIIGAVTWSAPATATFDNVLVTSQTR